MKTKQTPTKPATSKFTIERADGKTDTIEAAAFRVEGCGLLILTTGCREVAVYAQGQWVRALKP